MKKTGRLGVKDWFLLKLQRSVYRLLIGVVLAFVVVGGALLISPKLERLSGDEVEWALSLIVQLITIAVLVNTWYNQVTSRLPRYMDVFFIWDSESGNEPADILWWARNVRVGSDIRAHAQQVGAQISTAEGQGPGRISFSPSIGIDGPVLAKRMLPDEKFVDHPKVVNLFVVRVYVNADSPVPIDDKSRNDESIKATKATKAETQRSFWATVRSQRLTHFADFRDPENAKKKTWFQSREGARNPLDDLSVYPSEDNDWAEVKKNDIIGFFRDDMDEIVNKFII